MKSLKKFVLVSALLLLAVADSHARPRLFGRRAACSASCGSAAPTAVYPRPAYQPAPAVVMPMTGVVTLPARVVQAVGGCVGNFCPAR